MNRRGFFQAVTAVAAAIFLPKSKPKADLLTIDDDDTLRATDITSMESDFVISTDPAVPEEDVGVVIWDNPQTGDYFYDFHNHKFRYYDGTGWIGFNPNHKGFIIKEENQNAKGNEST
jgi:hypothetical protein